MPIIFLIKLITNAIILASTNYFFLRDALLASHLSWQMIEVNSKWQLKILTQRSEQFMSEPHTSFF
jgi:hypothetical protein